MWVPELGGEEELEVFRVVDDVIADFNAEDACIFEGLFCEDRIEDCINFFLDGFYDETLTELHCCLETANKGGVGLFDDCNFIVCFVLPQPSERLQLRVDHE